MPSMMDEVMAKTMKTAKAGKAFIEGLTGVFKTLAEQHGEVAAMLRSVEKDDSKRMELWPKIRKELLSHEQGELREVYPVLRQHPETREFAEKHDREAAELQSQIARIQEMPIDATSWGESFSELVKTVQDHVDEEESQIFPKAEEVLGKERTKEIEPRFLAAKKSAMESL